MKIEFKTLEEIEPFKVIEMMNHPLVRRHMPLAKEVFDLKAYHQFIEKKAKLWKDYGYGPWAFVGDGIFLGWGGLQYENGDADLALILHPDHWGLGKTIFHLIVDKAFYEMGFESITVLFPPTRTRIKGLFRLNFQVDGELEIDGERFLRYRLYKASVQ